VLLQLGLGERTIITGLVQEVKRMP